MNDVECPAEIYIERVSPMSDPFRTCYYWVWEIVQPDSHWGVWEEGRADSYTQALAVAQYALNRVHKKQGYL